ncbi:MAG: hypothetical protein WCK10_03605 [Candidatus Staskawiczbacteria bacterium]
MCFYIHSDHPTVKTVEEDIVCYKLFSGNDSIIEIKNDLHLQKLFFIKKSTIL